MLTKEQAIEKIKFAMSYEESLLPELEGILNQKLLTYRLPPEKEQEAKRLLELLISESKNHYKLLMQAQLDVEGSDKDGF